MTADVRRGRGATGQSLPELSGYASWVASLNELGWTPFDVILLKLW
jgi:hypothetical protein